MNYGRQASAVNLKHMIFLLYRIHVQVLKVGFAVIQRVIVVAHAN